MRRTTDLTTFQLDVHFSTVEFLSDVSRRPFHPALIGRWHTWEKEEEGGRSRKKEKGGAERTKEKQTERSERR